jgi:ABC-type antimicrobial peptide transport system permease subunit
VGAYGVVSFAVTVRRRELAIRQALGALPREVFGVALADGMILAIAGVVVGLCFVVPLAMLLESAVHGVRAFDPVALGTAAALLLLVAFAASFFPALRAASLDTMKALREE